VNTYHCFHHLSMISYPYIGFSVLFDCTISGCQKNVSKCIRQVLSSSFFVVDLGGLLIVIALHSFSRKCIALLECFSLIKYETRMNVTMILLPCTKANQYLGK